MRRRAAQLARVVLGERYESVRGRLFREQNGRPLPRDHAEAWRLLESGFFDADFYHAQAANRDATPFGCALNFIRWGSRQGLAPHPLIEPAYLPGFVRNALAVGHVGPYLDHLRSASADGHAWGPIFDPRPSIGDIAERHASDVFFELTDETVLPVPPTFQGEPETWGEARRSARERATELRRIGAYRKARLVTSWDEELEHEWIDRARAWALPKADGRPLVTVVMPVWNRASTVTDAIRSVQAQSFSDWELIVVDDGSEDDTVAVLRALAETDPRLVVVETPHGGVCAARNAGLDRASADFIAFLDSDNAWTPEFLNLAVRALHAGDSVAVYSALRSFEGSGAVKYRGAQVDRDDLLVDNSVDMNTLITRTALVREVGGFDTSLRRWVDYDLVLRISAKGRLEYLPFIGCEYQNDPYVARITNNESSGWEYVVIGGARLDWDEIRGRSAQRVTGRVSVVVVTHGDHVKTRQAVDSLLLTAGGRDIEIVIVDNGSAPYVGRVLTARYAAHSAVRYEFIPRNLQFALGSNIGFARTTGEFVFFLNNDMELRGDWMPVLLAGLSDSGATAVQPVITHADGTVYSAGYVHPIAEERPSRFLDGHPVADARRLSERSFDAISGAAMLWRARDFAELGGFDPLFVNGLEDADLCRRAARDLGAKFALVSEVVAVHHFAPTNGRFTREEQNRRLFLARWRGALHEDARERLAELGFEPIGFRPDLQFESGSVQPVLARARTVKNSDSSTLRWAIKIGADNTRGGDLWGDVPFADDLAVALEDLGQIVSIDRYGAFGRPTAYLDDVVLAIRGRHPVNPQPGLLNILWVISRPDLVTADEVRGFDLVFAASPTWAEWMSKRAGVEVGVLLQATNPRRFFPASATDEDERNGSVVFVGGPRPGFGRQIVTDALASGHELELWGPRWEEYAPVHMVQGHYVNADEVPAVYRGARVMLNDHLPDMAKWGFVNNRLFDVIASGTPAISDDVEGLDLFDGAVVAYRDAEHLARLLASTDWMPPADALTKISARIAAEHSFDARAGELLSTALRAIKLKLNADAVTAG